MTLERVSVNCLSAQKVTIFYVHSAVSVLWSTHSGAEVHYHLIKQASGCVSLDQILPNPSHAKCRFEGFRNVRKKNQYFDVDCGVL